MLLLEPNTIDHRPPPPPAKNYRCRKGVLLWLILWSCWRVWMSGRHVTSPICAAESHVGRWRVSVDERWPNKERSFTNIHVTSLMLFIHFHIVLQSNAKQCRDSIISHSKAWITSGFCKRVLMKTLLCVHSWCIRVRRALLSASGRLISLIAARRRPSTRRPRGIATETQSNENYTWYLKYFWK